jgi:hypothetical protein
MIRLTELEDNRADPPLLDMTLGAFKGSGADAGMAILALGMGGFSNGHHLGIFEVFFVVALIAHFRIGRPTEFRRVAFIAADQAGVVIAGMMMAFETVIDAVPVVRGVLKKNVAGGTSILNPDRVFRSLGGKGGVAENADNEEDDGHAENEFDIFLRSHRRSIPSYAS